MLFQRNKGIHYKNAYIEFVSYRICICCCMFPQLIQQIITFSMLSFQVSLEYFALPEVDKEDS